MFKEHKNLKERIKKVSSDNCDKKPTTKNGDLSFYHGFVQQTFQQTEISEATITAHIIKVSRTKIFSFIDRK